MSASEIKTLLDEQGRVFEAFKAAFDEKHGQNVEEIGRLNGELDRLADRIDETRAAMRRSATAEVADQGLQSPERKAFARFLKKGKENVGPEELKVLLLADDTAGGYLAPSEMVHEIIKGEAELSPMRHVARVRQTTARTLEIPRRSGQFSAVWTGEIEIRSETEGLAWGLEEIPTHELTAEVYLSQQIRKDADGAIDAIFDADATGANAPSGWTVMGRLGAVMSDGAANIRGFVHDAAAGLFLFTEPALQVDVGDQGTTAVLRSLAVPPGLRVKALLSIGLSHAGAQRHLRVRPPAVADQPVSTTAAPLGSLSTGPSGAVRLAERELWTDAGQQIETTADGADTALKISTLGWQEPRRSAGQDAGSDPNAWAVEAVATISSPQSNVDFTGLDSGREYRIRFRGVNFSGATFIALRISMGSGFITSGYNRAMALHGDSTSLTNSNQTSQSLIGLASGGSGSYAWGEVQFAPGEQAIYEFPARFEVFELLSGQIRRYFGSWPQAATTGAIDGIRIFAGDGSSTVDAGVFVLESRPATPAA